MGSKSLANGRISAHLTENVKEVQRGKGHLKGFVKESGKLMLNTKVKG